MEMKERAAAGVVTGSWAYDWGEVVSCLLIVVTRRRAAEVALLK